MVVSLATMTVPPPIVGVVKCLAWPIGMVCITAPLSGLSA
jgi:hypothetical protein